MGDRAGGIAVLDALIAIAPWNNEAFLRRGYLKQDSGALDDALSDFNHTIELEHSHLIGFPARGALLFDLGKLRESLADFRRLPDMVPRPDSSFKESMHLRIWLIRTRLGEGTEAVKELQGYLANRPSAAAQDWMLAVMRFAVGELGEAELLASVPGRAAATGSEPACVAHYYVGAKHLLAGEQAVAIDHITTCVATARRDVDEIRSAEAELARLSQPRK